MTMWKTLWIQSGNPSRWTLLQVSTSRLPISLSLLSSDRVTSDEAEFRSGKAGDIVTTLVSIFETREVIISELQILLAQRLLSVKDYDAVKEVRSTGPEIKST